MQKEENRESHRRSQRGIAATKENKISRKDTQAQKKEGYKILAKFVGLPREYYPLCPRLGWEKKIRVPRTATDQNKGCLPKEAKNFKQEGKMMVR